MKTKYFSIFLAILINTYCNAHATEIDKNTAKMQAMDKITGRVSVINVPINGVINFGSLSILVRKCKTRPVEETPENFAFVDITDKNFKGEEVNIFKGWMLSSSPATHAVEHPIYDVWLLKCIDSTTDKTALLTEQQLIQRDSIPMKKQANTSVTINEKTISEENITQITKDGSDENSLENITHAEEFSFDEEENEIPSDAPENLID